MASQIDQILATLADIDLLVQQLSDELMISSLQ